MGFDDVLRTLRARLAMIGVLLLVGLALGAGMAALKTPQYKATSQILIIGPGGNPADISGQSAAIGKVATYIKILPSERYLTATIQKLKLTTTWQNLQDRVAVTNPAGTALLNIAVTDPSASRATAIANTLAEGWDNHLESIGQASIRSSVTSLADQPDSPTSPKLLLWIAIGGVLGLAVGTSTALARAALDRSVGEDDVTERFGLPLLGRIPLDPKATSQPLPVSAPGTSARAEALRQLRTNLQFLDLGPGQEPSRSILVTSAVGGEGKTTTACNVAVALAHAGLSVILVDADLRRRELARIMGTASEPGLTSVLGGWADIDDALQKWGVDGERLWVLGAGPTPPNPSELLASAQMQGLLRDLEERADLVILDGAPLLPVADSAALAAIASGAILVIAAGGTDRDQVRRALGVLQSLDVRVHGGVLNRTSRRDKDSKGYLPLG